MKLTGYPHSLNEGNPLGQGGLKDLYENHI